MNTEYYVREKRLYFTERLCRALLWSILQRVPVLASGGGFVVTDQSRVNDVDGLDACDGIERNMVIEDGRM